MTARSDSGARDTVAMHFAAAAVARLAPAVRDRVLAAAGIAPALLAVPAARVPAQAFAALWLAIAEAIDDEFFGLDTRRMKPGGFALVTRAAAGAPTLERALRQACRGFAVLLDDVTPQLELHGGQARLVIANRIGEPAARRFADETLLVMLLGLASWLAGQRLPLAAVHFAHAAPPHATEYAAMFCEHALYDRPRSALVFDAGRLAAPVSRGERALAEFLRDAPQSVFVRYRDPRSLTARVRRLLRESLGRDDGPRLDQAAAALGLAEATLRRRLEAEGTSFQRIKDGLRRDAAVHRLTQEPARPLAEIARELGFREPSAFHRAFKKWTGARPGEYRRRQGPGG